MLLEMGVPMKTIDGNRMIGTGFPTDEGARLAENLLAQKGLNWNELTIDLTNADAAMLISAFFNSFLQTIHERSTDRLDDAKRIQWKMKFEFQQESVLEWIYDFEPEAVH